MIGHIHETTVHVQLDDEIKCNEVLKLFNSIKPKTSYISYDMANC